MTERDSVSQDGRSGRRPWLIAACALGWLPAAGAVVTRVCWSRPESRIPTHWSGSAAADGFSDSSSTWIACLLLAVGAGVAGTLLLLLGSDVQSGRRAVVYGLLAAAGAAAAIAWPVFQLMEARYERIGTSAIGQPFAWWALAIGWGLVVLVVARPLKRNEIDVR